MAQKPDIPLPAHKLPDYIAQAQTEQLLRVIMLRPLEQDLRASVQHDPSEPGPILVVAIDDHRDRRVLGDIPQPLEHGARLAFWLLVDRYVE